MRLTVPLAGVWKSGSDAHPVRLSVLKPELGWGLSCLRGTSFCFFFPHFHLSRLSATPHVGSLQRQPSSRLPPPVSRSDLPSRCSDEDLNHAAIGPAVWIIPVHVLGRD